MNRLRSGALILASGVLLWACTHGANGADSPGTEQLLSNPGFEGGSESNPAGTVPKGWTFEKKARHKGTVAISTANIHSGTHALQLNPNEQNKGSGIAKDPLGVGHAFMPGKFRGKQVYISGWLGATGGATAVVGIYALKLTGGVSFVELKQTAVSGLKYREDVLTVPDSLKVLFVIVNCHAVGTSGSAYFDDISVSLTPPPAPANTERLEAVADIDAAREIRQIPPEIFGTNIEWIWGGNGLLNPATHRLDSDLVRLSRELGVSRLRFPGGIFSDFYHWRNGIGPADRRPTTESMPGGTKSDNSFGVDEALQLSKELNAPLVNTVNIVTGTPAEAVELLRYEKLTASRIGAPVPRDWELGNEQYNHDGSPHAKAGGMTPEHYAEVSLTFARALKAADPSIRLGAIADENYSTIVPGYANWTETVLKRLHGTIDFLSVHNAYAPAVIGAKNLKVRDVYGAMLAAPQQIARALDNTADKISRLGESDSDRIGIAVTEWGPFFDLTPASPWVDHVKTMGSAVYVASALGTFISSPKVEAADFFKLNEELFMGWIGERNGKWTPKAPYYAFQLIRRNFGTRLIASSVDSPSYASHTAGWTSGMPQVPYVETLASLSTDKKTLYLIAINKNFDNAIPLTINLRNVQSGDKAMIQTLSGRSIDANTGTQLPEAKGLRWAKQVQDEKNPRFTQGGPGEVGVASSSLLLSGNRLNLTLPPLSVTSVKIATK